MLAGIPAEELAVQLDALVQRVLAAAGVERPPVDAFVVARALGMVIIEDRRQSGRARLARVKLANDEPLCPSIFLKPEPRGERRQWSVAHEIGEHLAADLFAALGIDPRDAPPQTREAAANHFAGRLLLPTDWFLADATACSWNLPRLKRIYSTASHELIARRMLDFSTPVIITIYDQGQMTWRRSNVHPRVAAPGEAERRCWRHTHESARPSRIQGRSLIECWPIHEPDWKREIVRTQPEEPW